ncbi:MAG: hypothetical protein LQ339_007046, partial [Xanthoria mediterranea]
MKLSNINPLLSVLLLRTATNVASAKIPQIPINDVQTCPTPTNGNECGFRYPGVYRIINYGFQNAAALNGTGPNAAVVSMKEADMGKCRPWNITDPAQQWGISYTDNTDNEVMIFSQVNGAALSAVENRKVVRAVHTPPYDKRAHWVMDRNAFANVEGVPIV